MFRKPGFITGGILLALLLALFLIPIVFQKQIGERIKEELNTCINAQVDYNGFSISIFRNFPDLTVSLNNLTVTGQDEFKSDTLASIKNFGFTVNLLNIIKGKGYQITSVNLQQPVLKLLVNKQGIANWDVIKKGSTFSRDTAVGLAQVDTGFIFRIDNWKVERARIEYKNDTAHAFFLADGFNSSYNRLLNKTGEEIAIEDGINRLTYTTGGITYLQNVKLNAAIKLSADGNTGLYQIKENNIHLNDLKLHLNGSVKNGKSGQYFDISLLSTDSAFKNLVSVFAGAGSNVAQINATGTFALAGTIKGLYNNLQSPAFSLQLNVQNGELQQPNLAKPVKHIYVEAGIIKPQGPLDSTIIQVAKMHVETGDDSVNATLLVTTPASDANMQAVLEGSIDLNSISAFYNLKGTKQLSGLLLVKLKFRGRKSDIDHKNYKLIQASGYAKINNVIYEGNGLPVPLIIKGADITVHPDFVLLDKLNARIGESDFSGHGNFEQVIPYLMNQERLIAVLNLRSDTISINSFIRKPAAPVVFARKPVSLSGTHEQVAEKAETREDFLLTVVAQANVAYYDKLVLHKLNGRLEADQSGVTIKGVTANLFGGILFINSHTTQFKNGQADVSFQLRVNNMDIRKVYHSFPEAEKSTPWVQHLSGFFSGGVEGTGKIKADLSLNYKTLSARGRLQMPDMKIDEMPVLTEIGKLAKAKSFDHIEAKNVYSVFTYQNGTTSIDSTDIRFTHGERIQFKGINKPDETVDADINLDVPVKEFGSIANMAQNLLSGFMKVPDNVKFIFTVTGKNTQPVVKLVNVGTSEN